MKALYVTDREAIGDSHFGCVLASLAGLPSLRVELREKGTADRESLAWAASAREKLGPAVPLFINRRFDLALAAGADGVHLPADGLPFPRVRAGTPRGLRIGVSVHSLEEAEAAIVGGADMVVLGPIFDTPSKSAYGAPHGPEVLGGLPLLTEHGAEVYAIGGIDAAHLDELEPYRDRISGVAAIRLFQEAPDPRAAAERIAAR